MFSRLAGLAKQFATTTARTDRNRFFSSFIIEPAGELAKKETLAEILERRLELKEGTFSLSQLHGRTYIEVHADNKREKEALTADAIAKMKANKLPVLAHPVTDNKKKTFILLHSSLDNLANLLAQPNRSRRNGK